MSWFDPDEYYHSARESVEEFISAIKSKEIDTIYKTYMAIPHDKYMRNRHEAIIEALFHDENLVQKMIESKIYNIDYDRVVEWCSLDMLDILVEKKLLTAGSLYYAVGDGEKFLLLATDKYIGKWKENFYYEIIDKHIPGNHCLVTYVLETGSIDSETILTILLDKKMPWKPYLGSIPEHVDDWIRKYNYPWHPDNVKWMNQRGMDRLVKKAGEKVWAWPCETDLSEKQVIQWVMNHDLREHFNFCDLAENIGKYTEKDIVSWCAEHGFINYCDFIKSINSLIKYGTLDDVKIVYEIVGKIHHSDALYDTAIEMNRFDILEYLVTKRSSLGREIPIYYHNIVMLYQK